MSRAPYASEFLIVDPTVADRSTFDMDGFETTVLIVSRHLFDAFSTPQSHSWMEAFLVAEQAFPVPFGATIGHAITQIISEMRISRRTTFSYYPNSDPLADAAFTREERYLIQALQAVRTGAHSQASAHAMLLCGGGETRGLLAALERLCLITGDVLTPRYQNTPAVETAAAYNPAN